MATDINSLTPTELTSPKTRSAGVLVRPRGGFYFAGGESMEILTFHDLKDEVERIAATDGDHLEMLVNEIETRIGRDLTLVEHSVICAANLLGLREGDRK